MIYTKEAISKKIKKKENIKKFLNAIITFFICILVIFTMYLAYVKYIKHEKNINIFGLRQYMIMTGSMEPDYNIGDLIITKEINQENIKKGDIITYALADGNATVTHRIIDVIEKDGKTMYKTKGDNNNAPDQNLVEYNQIQGVFLFKINNFGAILSSFLTKTGIVIIFLIVIFSYLRANSKEEKRIAREDIRRRYNIPKYKKEEPIWIQRLKLN